MKYMKWILVLLILMVPMLASAQMNGTDRVVAQVPFTFVVANTVVPYGKLVIQRAGPSGNVLALRNADTRIRFFVAAAPKKGFETAGAYSLVFHRYGHRYFLTAIKLEGSNIVYTVPASRYEAELLAQNTPVTEEILLASNK